VEKVHHCHRAYRRCLAGGIEKNTAQQNDAYPEPGSGQQPPVTSDPECQSGHPELFSVTAGVQFRDQGSGDNESRNHKEQVNPGVAPKIKKKRAEFRASPGYEVTVGVENNDIDDRDASQHFDIAISGTQYRVTRAGVLCYSGSVRQIVCGAVAVEFYLRCSVFNTVELFILSPGANQYRKKQHLCAGPYQQFSRML